MPEKITLRDLWAITSKLDDKIDGLVQDVANLPCKLHEFRISNLEKREEKCFVSSKNQKTAQYDRKTKIIIALIGAVATLTGLIISVL